MTSASFARPGFDRWDRPSSAPERRSGVHPGRFAQGPEEKCGRFGRWLGFIVKLLLALSIQNASVGRFSLDEIGRDPELC
jgi:hypothetical protein